MDNSRHYVLRGKVGHISIHLQTMMKLNVKCRSYGGGKCYLGLINNLRFTNPLPKLH